MFDRRDELGSTPCAFIVDRDMWVFSGVPDAYESDLLVITSGYSIENDLFEDGRMYDLLDRAEKAGFDRDIRPLAQWFAREGQFYLAGEPYYVDLHVDQIVDSAGSPNPALWARRKIAEVDAELHDRVLNDYTTLIRGKNLMSLLWRYTAYKGRVTKHNGRNLMEMASVSGGGNMTRVFEAMERVFS